MKYTEAIAAIRRKTEKKIFLITGEESYFAESARKEIFHQFKIEAGDEGIQRMEGEVELAFLLHSINAAPFFSEYNFIWLRNTSLFKEKKDAEPAEGRKKKGGQEEELLKALADMPPYTILLFEQTEKADKRRKLYKLIEKYGMVIEADPLQPWTVGEWLRHKIDSIGKTLDGEAFVYLTEAVGAMQQISLGFLANELEKLALYTEKKKIGRQDLQIILSGLPEISIFAMLDAISEKKTARALCLLEEQLESGIHPVQIVALLIRHIRQLLQAKKLEERGVQGRQMAAALGVVPFVAEKIGKNSRRFQEKVLKKALLELLDGDYKLKSGQAEPAMMERIIIEVCQGT